MGRELDPANVGIDIGRQPADTWIFETDIHGNRNIGHEYGVDLSDAQKRALVEYLKTR